MLNAIPAETATLIKKSVANHNVRFLPENEDEEILFFTRLVRDADKLDIFSVCCNEYKNNIYDPILSFELPKIPEVSDIVFEQLMNGYSVAYKDLKTYSDFKLIKFGWLTDINFLYTFKLIKEKGYLEIILQSMPQTEKILIIYNKTNAINILSDAS